MDEITQLICFPLAKLMQKENTDKNGSCLNDSTFKILKCLFIYYVLFL